MSVFNYKALDAKGKETKGIIEGDSPRQVRQLLRERKLNPLEVTETTQHVNQAIKNTSSSRPISHFDLVLLTQQLSALLNSGMPLEEALLTVSQQTQKLSVKSTILQVRARVLEGYSLAAALAESPRNFSALYQATIAAGEQVGKLDFVLERLAQYLERQQFIRQKLQQALIYPSLMVLVSITIVSFLLAFVVPKIVNIFAQVNQQLPTMTTILITLSDWIKNEGIYVLAITILGIIFFRKSLAIKKIKYAFHALLLKIPFIGSAIKTINTARFVRTFGILFSSGVSVLEAMNVSAKLITNLPIKEAIETAVTRVREGSDIHRALDQTGYFSPMAVHLIASGETSGQLEPMLTRVASYQEQAITRLIDTGLALFEPLMILMMGAIVLFIVLAILLPIFDMNNLIS